MSFTDFDIEDLKSTKKAVWTLSCAILLISALDLRSDEISLLGLKVGVSQEKVVSILWLILLLPFIRYVGAIVHDAYISYCSYLQNCYSIENETALSIINGTYDHPRHDHDEQMDGFELSHYDKSKKRTARIQQLETIANWSRYALNMILPRSTIIVIAIIALLKPNMLKDHLDSEYWWTKAPIVQQQAEQTETEEPVQPPAE